MTAIAVPRANLLDMIATAVSPCYPVGTVSGEPIFETRDLGRAIRQRRRAFGLSQSALAELAGVGRTAVQRLEQGRGTVTLDSALRIVSILSADLVFRERGVTTLEHTQGDIHAN